MEQAALERKAEVVSIIDPFYPKATHQTFSDEAMDGVDVCICFSPPSAALENITDACHWKKQLVIGTTGWTDQMDLVKQIVNENGLGLVYSSNFSIGMNIFYKIIELASHIIDKFDAYDILGNEAHHNRKLDSPSGLILC